jgi:hypothetical protein
MGQFRIRNNTSEDNPDWYTVLSLKDNASAYFAPWSISAGTGYYARHPLAFSSKISDETSMKNRVMATSMRQRVSDARSLQKSNEFETLSSWAIPSHSIMNISEDVEEGRARFGVLQGVMYYDKVGEDLEADYYKSALRRSPVEFEEEYRGNFHISSSMNLTTGYDYDYKGLYGGRDYKNDYDYLPCCTLDVVAKMLDANFTKDDDALDDLPCCSGGYYKLSNYYQDLLGESMEGLFNCSCFKIWGNMTG